jgi:hypothetical protein
MHQAGYFSASQARSVGYSYQAQKYHADRGSWTRVDRGLFRLPGWPARKDDLYVLWRLWSQDRGVVSHQSALHIYGLTISPPELVHLTVPPGFRAVDPSVVLHMALLPSIDVEDRGSFRATTVERSLLDVAASAGQEELDSVLSQALERRLISPARLTAMSEQFSDRAALRIERALAHQEQLFERDSTAQ